MTIKPNCTVHRLLFDGRRATGVEVESGGERFVVEGHEMILSGGAIGSPHILMLSGVGPADHLRDVGVTPVHDLPGVGQNLRDHPIIYLAFKTHDAYPLDGLAPRMQVALRYTAEGSHLRNDLQVLMQSFAHPTYRPGGRPYGALGHWHDRGAQSGGGIGGDAPHLDRSPHATLFEITTTCKMRLIDAGLREVVQAVRTGERTRCISRYYCVADHPDRCRFGLGTMPWMPTCCARR